jgi:hypothetical protein
VKRESWHYFLAGKVERGEKYEWRDGYARVVQVIAGGKVESAVLYPWWTMREAQGVARKAGARAVFHPNREAAEAALHAATGGL